MESYEPINLVQQVQINPDQYDCNKFSELLADLNAQEFNQFCKHILYLSEFHDSNIGAVCTDQPEKIKMDQNEFWPLK